MTASDHAFTAGLEVILGAIAVWRITHLLHAEDGPARVLIRFREQLRRFRVGGVFDCFYCLSTWIALPLALWLAWDLRSGVLLWLGFAGAAILLERWSNPFFVAPPPESPPEP